MWPILAIHPKNSEAMVELKANVAQAYFPRLTVSESLRQLRRTIKSVPEMEAELAAANAQKLPKRRHYFTKEEVDIIQKYLGRP